MKRVCSMLLVICLLMSLVPVSARASDVVASGEWGQEGSDVRWSLDSDGNMTISGTGAMFDCHIVNITQYETTWFRGWDDHLQDIKTVTIEDGITYIGNESFSGAGNLKKVTIADSVTSIGWRAFANCDSLVEILFGEGLESMNIEVFLDCDALENFYFPNTATEYGNHLLAKCDNLKNVVLSDKMTTISDGMFKNCVSLESISIPTNITVLGGSAFSGCIRLKEITIPESVTEIGGNAFAYCEKLENVSLPNSLISMGNTVFENCQSLKTITVPANVTTMAHTFERAYGLESVKFLGNLPICGGDLFGGITITAYYPSNNQTWTENARQDYGGTVTWVSYESDITPSDTIASGACGDGAYWKLTSNLTLVISGTGDMYDYSYDAPWSDYTQKIEHVVIEPGITKIGRYAFIECRALQSVTIADTVTQIGENSFTNCVNLLKLEIPESVEIIHSSAFSGCSGLQSISFYGDAPQMGGSVFYDVTTTAYYPAGNETWTADIMQHYDGSITWVKNCPAHDYASVVTEPTCVDSGYTTHICSLCGDSYVDTPVAALGHTWQDNGPGEKVCTVCGHTQTGYRIPIDSSAISTNDVVWVDGMQYTVNEDGGNLYIAAKTSNATNLVVYTYNDPSATDVHTQYPTGMKVWILNFVNGQYTTTYVKEFENLLQYSGSSIRITGNKGIRMITSITKDNKKALTGSGLAGYTLLEYGTALAWASDLEGGNPLTLGQAYTKSNYAYKKGVADPVFKDTGNLVQYTNVLVGFNDDQCIPDIAMRPYIIVKDATGREITIYGGIIYRSIGYIAYQNRNAFSAGSNSYNYVWSIIHHVYGNKYDSEYKG